MQHPESNEQIALFQWARLQEKAIPELKLMFAIPNGGKRKKVTAIILKAEGVKSGVPDVCLPVPIGEWHGLYIEMKAEKRKPSENQEWWLLNLAKRGYKTHICYSWIDAKNIILAYLKKPNG